MKHAIRIHGAAALGVVLGLTSAANAQTVQRHATGRHIVVHPRESYLTAGPGASVGEHNGYALDTFQLPGEFLPKIDHTFLGMRGEDRLPNNYTLPGCCVP